MTWEPVGLWDLDVRPLGMDPRLLAERAVVAVVVHDGTVAVAAAEGSAVSAGVWHLAGAGRVVLRFEGRWGVAAAAVELTDDDRSCHGRVMGRPAPTCPGAPGIVAADVVGRRRIVEVGEPGATVVR